MQHFALPDFYMPWSARVNPNLEGARVHCKEWAYMVGILGAGEDAVWDEKTFDRMDFAAFAAATHPDAPAPELNLITDWYIWGWFIDDYFAQTFERGSSDMEQANAYLSRLLSFMPTDLNTPIPEPQNPPEFSLVDLWPRTAPTMSEQWRQRYIEHILVMAEASRQELLKTSKNKERILDPVEYIILRRKLSGMSWAADLVEHSLASEIPPEIYDTRTIRVLNDTYADRGALWNDILSYHHDIDDGKVNNCVVVLQHFLNTDLQTAVNLVNDLATSRLYQFENTLSVELYPAMDECGLDGAARQQVLRYVKALQDWMAGELEWAIRPGGRYLPVESEQDEAQIVTKRLNTAMARAGLSPSAMGLRVRTYNYVPFQTVGAITFPEFYMPFSTELNPHLEEGLRISKEWAYEMGMIGIPGISFWDEDKFDAIDTALMCALIYPKASHAVYDLTTKCNVWGIYTDGYFDGRYLATRDIVGGKLFLARLLALISSDSVPIAMPTNPSERGLADLWQRMAASVSPERKQQMRCDMAKMFKSWVWQLDNQIQNRIPDPIDYIETRFNTVGFDLLMLLNQSDKTPPELYDTPSMCSLYKAAGDVVGLTNDIVSYQKEMESEGIVSNGVLVTQHFLDCDVAQSVEIVNNLITARVREFEHIVATELPDLCDDFNLDISTREKLFGYVEQLQFMMCGMLKWHVGARCYKESEFGRDPSPRNLFNAPTTIDSPAPAEVEKLLIGVLNGLGTSAARIGTPSSKTDEVRILSIPTEKAISSTQLVGIINGLGTSAAKIGTPSSKTGEGSIQSILIEKAISSTQLVGIINGLGTSAAKIGTPSSETAEV
ncbi:terpene synthase family protein [Limnofasciculus baicalensis]|uniref:Germacradienol/geosmin synthase n=1 Tax=Limnofasciculus baicalensis BBK-W-15 TaxID=2699891 RepID=A0AAE3KSE5_9CYAN|nr:germacradienol/geosmin synthase [Limnofasciculus baicalensis]MCP2729392.1 germacradienol/geosmin synthase [Limnofasciculus baicalensis BBK-W-15]